MLVNDIEINRDKIFEQDENGKFPIYPPYKRTDLPDTVKLFYNLMKQFNHILLKSKMFVKMKDKLIDLFY